MPSATPLEGKVAVVTGDGLVDVLVDKVGDHRPNGLFVRTDEQQWDAQHAITL